MMVANFKLPTTNQILRKIAEEFNTLTDRRK